MTRDDAVKLLRAWMEARSALTEMATRSDAGLLKLAIAAATAARLEERILAAMLHAPSWSPGTDAAVVVSA